MKYPEIADALERAARHFPEITSARSPEMVYIEGRLIIRCLPYRAAILSLAKRYRRGYTRRNPALTRSWGASTRREPRLQIEKRYKDDPDLPQFLAIL